jgi:hypothetical protein
MNQSNVIPIFVATRMLHEALVSASHAFPY